MDILGWLGPDPGPGHSSSCQQGVLRWVGTLHITAASRLSETTDRSTERDPAVNNEVKKCSKEEVQQGLRLRLFIKKSLLPGPERGEVAVAFHTERLCAAEHLPNVYIQGQGIFTSSKT